MNRTPLEKAIDDTRILVNSLCPDYAYVDERRGITGGVEFRVMYREHGKEVVLFAIRVEPF